MIPTARLAWLAALGLPLILLGLFGPSGLFVAAAYDIALVLAVLTDRIGVGDPSLAEVEREAPLRWVQGRPGSVRIHVKWHGRRTGRLEIRDIPPAAFQTPTGRLCADVSPGRSLSVSYEAVPLERGFHSFGDMAIRSRGPLGLVERQCVVRLPLSVSVFPDLVTISAREAALIAPSAWRPGGRRGQVMGEGREFHQLRDYSAGDDVRLLDWKAFAHRGRPAVRDYRAERNQRMLILLDAGRLMTAGVGDRVRFDWAVQAAGRLARVALAMGDSVGITSFSRDLKFSVPMSRGPGHLAKLARLLCEAQPDLDEPDLGAALRSLLHGNPRRTLVVLFTEIADRRAANATVSHMGSLAPRHLGLVVTLADTDLEAERVRPLRGVDDAYRRLAAEELWDDALRTETALQSRGALVVRARADALAGEAVERYIAIKRSGRL